MPDQKKAKIDCLFVILKEADMGDKSPKAKEKRKKKQESKKKGKTPVSTKVSTVAKK